MYRVDTQKLIGKIAQNGFTFCSFAAALEISRQTLRLYLRDFHRIPYKIIVRMVELLHCTRAEAIEIFFARELT